ncbi:hypothetical protein V6N12_032787 [Hibiscus sabdariffa]|uniref:Uncharacterized protein n=1 Tax=Hibiscus sabdariffa TaxID=183260 RepID=A0ABR2APY8_9ROSI
MRGPSKSGVNPFEIGSPTTLSNYIKRHVVFAYLRRSVLYFSRWSVKAAEVTEEARVFATRGRKIQFLQAQGGELLAFV